MNRYLFQMVTSPSQIYRDEETGEETRFSCDRKNVLEISAINYSTAVFLAGFQGLKENVHYNDVLKLTGVIGEEET